MMEWISVKDRLPEQADSNLGYTDKVLAFSDKFQGKYSISRYDHMEKVWTYESGNDSYYNPITHWMPLPEPPKP